ncbi:MAG: ATP-dependent DNA helicase RecG [Paracoccaceae bacterium]
MSGRPPSLYPLFAGLDTLPGIGPKTAQSMTGLSISTPRDVIFTLPVSGIDRALSDTIQGADFPRIVTVKVKIGPHHAPRLKGRPYRIDVHDSQMAFQLVYFHARADYLQRLLPVGQERIVSGKAEMFDGLVQMPHPDHVVLPEELATLPNFEPVYPLTSGVTQKLMAKAAQETLKLLPEMPEWIDPSLISQQVWPSFQDAVTQCHGPTSMHAMIPTDPARARLAYDELFSHQLTLSLARAREQRVKGRKSLGTGQIQDQVLTTLPYAPTAAQTRSVSEILADMGSKTRMNRLLQGDVGSGKTLVAFLAMVAAVEAGGQAVLMAPTEILARQHLEGLQPLAEQAGVVLEILTGRDKGRDRADKLGALASGKIQILVGTHAVFQKDVDFQDLRLAIVDEQHRFGVRQRLELGKKGISVDVLVMTATPIPRSLALAQYGDMDVSVLDEKPAGRKPITTALISTERLEDVVARLRGAIQKGMQCYWVCPLVEESEVVDLTAAEDRFKHLRAAIGEEHVGLVHGQMPPAEKDAAMARFQSGQTQVLVATTVIEVGVNVPNATIMVIERAETFGLAQLHQLRGRVGRGSQASTCLLLYQAPLSETGRRRLEVLRHSEDGFEIAQTDLEMRGAGDLIGTAQSGLPKFRVADLERQAGLMQIAQTDARALLQQDPELKSSRGEAVRLLLWLMRQDEAIRLISVG